VSQLLAHSDSVLFQGTAAQAAACAADYRLPLARWELPAVSAVEGEQVENRVDANDDRNSTMSNTTKRRESQGSSRPNVQYTQRPIQRNDRSRVRDLVRAAGATLLEGNFLDFLDPWGNRVEVVEYRDIQFTKAPEVLRAMKFPHLEKSDEAKKQLADKGIR
jgi:hypothetical protein